MSLISVAKVSPKRVIFATTLCAVFQCDVTNQKPPYCDGFSHGPHRIARVSTTDQDLDIQNKRLKDAGCEVIRSETGSSVSRKGRSELETIMQFLRAGDELVVLRLDRLGRSTRDVLNLVHELDEKGAALRVLEPEVTTTGGMGRMVITILDMVADMELVFIKDRQRAGIEAANAEGVYKGRRKNVDDAEIRRRIADGESKAAVARDLKVSRMTVFRALDGLAPGPDQ